MKHQVVISIKDKNGDKTQVLRGAQMSLPRRLIKWLFGDYTQVYLLEPGKTVESVDIKEVVKGETL